MAEEKLNIKQQQFLDEYIKCGNATKAYMKVYKLKNEDSAASAAWRLLRNVEISDLKKRQLEKAGLTHDKIFSKIHELLDATKPIACNIYIKKGSDPAEQLKDADGVTKDFIEVADNATQVNAAKLAAQIAGALKNDDEEEATIPVKLTFKVPANWRPKR